MAGRLILMGSGETSTHLVAAHRLGIEAAGADHVLVLDTPYGFQENAPLISRKLAAFFRTSLSIEADTASYRSGEEGAVACEAMLAAVRGARYVFSGPGSPTYALGVWKETPLAPALRDRLSSGATVTMASAAALTAGTLTLPVYDIYKVGAALGWSEGLDLTSHLGLEAVFIPHWNNTEGQGFDTSRCYMGRRRFDLLKAMLPAGMGIIGVDEHTAAVIDFGAAQLQVIGAGQVTLCGESTSALGDGESIGLEAASKLLGAYSPPPTVQPPDPVNDLPQALANRSASQIASALLELESQAAQGSERARESLRSVILEIAQLAASGLVQPVEWVGDYVDLLVEIRSDLRAGKRWEEADRIRAGLESFGVTLRDTPSGAHWRLDATPPSEPRH
ncbi:MAG: hypothetical protein OXC98_01430 [bacterium]|nr:hypothetical protein [Acidimicrobiia bacterium]MCY4649017.1 hypothetical protein [bacterium]